MGLRTNFDVLEGTENTRLQRNWKTRTSRTQHFQQIDCAIFFMKNQVEEFGKLMTTGFAITRAILFTFLCQFGRYVFCFITLKYQSRLNDVLNVSEKSIKDR